MTKFIPNLADWSWFWLLSYLLAFVSFLPIAFLEIESAYLYSLKDLLTLNQAHLAIHSTTSDYIPIERSNVPYSIQLILALISISTVRALVIFFARIQRVLKLINDGHSVTAIEGMPAKQKQEIQIRKIKLILCEDTPPLAYGFLAKYVLLPHNIKSMTTEHVHMLIEHELQHHRAYDTKKVILLRLLSGVFWFNPFVHYLEKRFILAMESNCDSAVVKSLNISASEYSKSLISCLKVCQFSNESELTAYFSSPNSLKDEIEIRITKVMRSNQYVSGRTAVQTIAFCMLIIFTMILIKSGFFTLNLSTKNEGQLPINAGYISYDYSESNDNPHYGIDIQAPHGSIVNASFTGKVIIADASSLDKGLGKTILIEHKDNTASLYANLDHVFVHVGQIVKAGDEIGSLGDTLGQSSNNKVTPHLHFEISKSGKHVNPHHFLKGLKQQ